MEILVQAAVKTAESLNFIVYGVGMNDIHKYGQTGTVGRINEGFQLIRCAVT